MVSMMDKQQIPAGYKQTEVGVIPEDWVSRSIGEFCDVSSGGTPNRENKEYWNGHIPWVTTALINGGEITQADQFITDKALVSSATKWIKKGTLLIAMYGQGKTRGKVSVLGIDATINQACAAISINDSVSGLFLLHFLNSQYEEIRDLSNSGGQENLSGTIVKQIKVPVPPLKEQTAIANALSDVDALIAALEKLIDKKTAIKTATMQQLLTGKKRLPPFDQLDAGYKQTELGEIPKDWEVKTVDEITTKVGSGKTPTGGSTVYISHGIPLVRSQNVGWGHLLLDDVAYISEKIHETFLGSELKEGDVLLNITGASIGRSSIVTDQLVGGNVNQHVCIIRTTTSVDSRLICSIILSSSGQSQIDSFQAGGNREGLNFNQVKAMKFALPESQEEQTAIANVLSDMDTELDALQQRLAKTQHIKQGMMQELLTGKTRLPINNKEQ